MAKPAPLTEAKVRSTKCREKRFEIADGVLRGLKLVMEPSGFKNWRYRTTIRGRRRWIDVGHHTSSHSKNLLCPQCKSVTAARESAVVLAGIVRAQDDVERMAQVTTFGAVAEEWLEDRRLRHEKAEPGGASYPSMRRLVAIYRRECAFWSMPVADITPRYIAEFVKPYHQKYTAMGRRHLSTLRVILSAAVEAELIEHNPARAVDLKNKEENRTRYLYDHEIRKLWPVWERGGFPGANYQLLLLTCSRPKEIRTLEWSRVDFDSKVAIFPKTLEINGKTTQVVKNRYEHLIHLSPMACDILHRVRESTGAGRWVFPTATDPSRPLLQVPTRVRSQFIREAGVDHFQLRDMRPTGGTILSREFEVDELIIGAAMNHSRRASPVRSICVIRHGTPGEWPRRSTSSPGISRVW